MKGRFRTSLIKRQYLNLTFPKTKPEEFNSQRTELENTFFVKGNAGGKMVGEYEKLKKITLLPKFLIEIYKTGISKESPETQVILEKLLSHFEEDFQYIVPSFFKLIIFLRKNKREFGLVFRSRKNDAAMFYEELNLFFNGEHLLYNGKNGTQMAKMDNGKGGKNYSINQENCVVYSCTGNEFGQGQFSTINAKIGQDDQMPNLSPVEELFVRIDECLKTVF